LVLVLLFDSHGKDWYRYFAPDTTRTKRKEEKEEETYPMTASTMENDIEKTYWQIS